MERDIRPAKVLAVDDDLDTTGTVRAMVEMDGHECHTALNGWEALAMCRQHHFDCMFLDARLGSLSGLAVAQRLGGQDSSLRPRHIILLTGSPREDFHTALRDRVIDGYLQKPATLEGIRRALSRCLENS